MNWFNLLFDPEAAPGLGGAPDAGADPNPDPDAASLTAEGEDSTVDDTAEPEAEAEGEPEAGTGEPEGTEGQPAKEDGRVIPQWMRELKEKDPKAYGAAKADLFDLRARRGLHPTVKDAEAEHNLVTSVGGADGINTMRESAGTFKTIESQFLKGDPGFVADLWETDPIAAALHVQPMLDAMKAKDAEGYKGLVARSMHNEITSVGLPQGLKALQAAIAAGDKETAGKWLASIIQWQEDISGVANRAEDPRVKTMLAERAQQHDARRSVEDQEFQKNYETQAFTALKAEGGRIFESFFKGRSKSLTAEDKQDLLREAFGYATKTVTADAEFMKQRDGHLKRRDANAALQLVKAKYAQALPEAVKKVARRYGLLSGKAPQATIRQPNTPAQNKGTVTPAGFTKVNARPQPDEIDTRRTSHSDIISGKATLKDGRKVTWTHLQKRVAPAA